MLSCIHMEIITITPRGFCKGVVKAIQIAKETAEQNPDQPITILGELVHNKDVVEGLKHFGIETLESKDKTRVELLEDVTQGIVIFTAHGINPDVKAKADAKGLRWVDASCEDVVVTQRLVESYLKQGYHVLYIGQKGHPEAEAICTTDPQHVHLINRLEDFDQLPNLLEKVFVTNQTTMSVLDIQSLLSEAQKRYPFALISNEICSATRTRQEAILNLEPVDALIVVGDQKSNNTRMLAQIGRNKGIPFVHLVRNYHECDTIDFSSFKKIAITAGASTPTFLVNQVISYCRAISEGLDPHAEAQKIKPFL